MSDRLAGLKDSYWVRRLREYRHRWTSPRSYDRMAQALERFRQCRDRKPPDLMRREMHALQRFWSCKPLHYLRYDLYRADRRLSEAELLSYIPEFFFYGLFLPYHDPDRHSVVLGDKILAEQLLRSVDIRQPPTVGKMVQGRLCDLALREMPYATMLGALRERGAEKVFVKPADGQGGKGIWIFRRAGDGRYVTAEGQALSPELLLHLAGERDYLIQPGLVQARYLDAIYPHSVNTFRTVTENLRGRVRVVCSALRLGRGGRQLDNVSQDGIMIGIDVGAGAMRDTAWTTTCEPFTEHPDTGFAFSGYRIPRWDDVVRFVTDSAARLPQFTYLGWDIAVAEDGPMAVETNLGFGLDGIQMSTGGLREAFGIDAPAFYWRQRRPGR